jgi:hypothetical protein
MNEQELIDRKENSDLQKRQVKALEAIAASLVMIQGSLDWMSKAYSGNGENQSVTLDVWANVTDPMKF